MQSPNRLLLNLYAYPLWNHKLLRVYDALLRRFSNVPLPGRKFVIEVRIRDLKERVFIRLGSSDFVLLEQVFLGGEYEGVLQRDLGEVRLIVDLGSNIGCTLRLWHEKFPTAKIVGVEPDEANLALCHRNSKVGADSQKSDWLCLVHGCVAAQSGMVYLNRSELEWAYKMSHDEAGNGSSVQALSVPELLERCGTEETIDLLKCDIEGAEKEVFADCAGWIGRVRHLVIELHQPYTHHHLLEHLQASGYPFDHWRLLDQGDGHQVMLLHRD